MSAEKLWVVYFEDGSVDCLEAPTAKAAYALVPIDRGDIGKVEPYSVDSKPTDAALDFYEYVRAELGVSAEGLKHLINEKIAEDSSGA